MQTFLHICFIFPKYWEQRGFVTLVFFIYHREDLGVDGLIILGWISRRWDVGIWTGLGWPRIETGGGCL